MTVINLLWSGPDKRGEPDFSGWFWFLFSSFIGLLVVWPAANFFLSAFQNHHIHAFCSNISHCVMCMANTHNSGCDNLCKTLIFNKYTFVCNWFGDSVGHFCWSLCCGFFFGRSASHLNFVVAGIFPPPTTTTTRINTYQLVNQMIVHNAAPVWLDHACSISTYWEALNYTLPLYSLFVW